MTELIAYLHGRKNWTPAQIPGDKITYLNYSFAKIKGLSLGEDVPNIQKISEIRTLYPHLKINISIGGWAADGFSDAVVSQRNRETFSSEIVKFIKKYNFDGVDIDWEYPGSALGGIKARTEDAKNYTAFLKLLHTKLHAETKEYILSAAIGADADLIDSLAVDGQYSYTQYLDFINVMTYDLRGSWTNITGHHANLYAYPQENGALSANQAVKQLLSHHVPASKIVVGAAAYSRDWYTFDEPNTQPIIGKVAHSNGTHTTDYNDLKLILKKHPANCHWDNTALAPYYFDGEVFMSFEDTKSIASKAEFVHQNNLGGLMLWELSLDAESDLIRAAAETLFPTKKD